VTAQAAVVRVVRQVDAAVGALRLRRRARTWPGFLARVTRGIARVFVARLGAGFIRGFDRRVLASGILCGIALGTVRREPSVTYRRQ
jgi:hypothetical protein